MTKLVIVITLLMLSISNANAINRTVTVALTSNYVFRGQTQTDDKLAIQATYHAAQSKNKGWYAGMFASNVEKGAEVDLYGGWRAPFGDQQKFAFDVGAVQYLYTDSQFAESTYELYGGVSYETSYFRYFLGENSDYLDLSTSLYVLDEFGLELHYGRTFDQPKDGNDIAASLQKDIKGYLLGVSITYEDVTPRNEVEFFVTISRDFNL